MTDHDHEETMLNEHAEMNMRAVKDYLQILTRDIEDDAIVVTKFRFHQKCDGIGADTVTCRLVLEYESNR